MLLDLQAAIDAGAIDAPVFVQLSGESRAIALAALASYLSPLDWSDVTDYDTAQAAHAKAIEEIMTAVQIFPYGTVLPFAGSVANIPTGWLHCNGASLLTELYPNLFAAIGYSFGGSGAYYNVPELRNKFPRGGYSASGGTGGASTVTLAASNMPPHTHTYGTFTTTTPSGNVTGTGRYITGTTTGTSGSAGGTGGAAQPFSTLPPYTDILYMIYGGSIS